MANNHMDLVAKVLGVEMGEEFIIENADRRETVVIAADGLHVVQPNNVLGPEHGKLLSKVLQGLYEVKRKPWEPEYGDIYYVPNVVDLDVRYYPWHDQTFDFAMKALGMVYRTRKEAEAHFADDYERLTGKRLPND